MNYFEIALMKPDGEVNPIHRFVADDEKTMQRKFDQWLITKVILPASPDHKDLDIDDYIRITTSDEIPPILDELNNVLREKNIQLQLTPEDIIDWFGEGVYCVDFQFYTRTRKFCIRPVYLPGGCRFWQMPGTGIYFLKPAK
jgi:hypothetical protein